MLLLAQLVSEWCGHVCVGDQPDDQSAHYQWPHSSDNHCLLAQVAPNGTAYTAAATVPGQIHLDLEAAGIIPPTYVVPIIHICHFELNV